jgi:hypothetical protein
MFIASCMDEKNRAPGKAQLSTHCPYHLQLGPIPPHALLPSQTLMAHFLLSGAFCTPTMSPHLSIALQQHYMSINFHHHLLRDRGNVVTATDHLSTRMQREGVEKQAGRQTGNLVKRDMVWPMVKFWAMISSMVTSTANPSARDENAVCKCTEVKEEYRLGGLSFV